MQLLSQLMQKKKFDHFDWTMDVCTDENGYQLHQATFLYPGLPIVTSEKWHRTAAAAREDAARIALPQVRQALGPP
jgi:hypothetical protein